jgi:predicted SAM-dependent methyltransferase
VFFFCGFCLIHIDFEGIEFEKFSMFSKTLKDLIKHFFTMFRILLGKFRAKKLLDGRKLCLNLGAGAFSAGSKNGWVAVDLAKGADLCCDLRQGLPFPDSSVSQIYSSHFLEHLTYPEVCFVLSECHRVLVFGGTLSVCVPNARLYAQAYLNNSDNLGKEDVLGLVGYPQGFNNTTRIDYLNYVAYLGNQHRYMFDEENLLFLLRGAGFFSPCLRDFDPAMDNPNRRLQSLCVLARK